MITNVLYLYSKNVKKQFPTKNFFHFILLKFFYLLSSRDHWISLRYLFYFSFYKTVLHFYKICISNSRFLTNLIRNYVSTMSIIVRNILHITIFIFSKSKIFKHFFLIQKKVIKLKVISKLIPIIFDIKKTYVDVCCKYFFQFEKMIEMSEAARYIFFRSYRN